MQVPASQPVPEFDVINKIFEPVEPYVSIFSYEDLPSLTEPVGPPRVFGPDFLVEKVNMKGAIFHNTDGGASPAGASPLDDMDDISFLAPLSEDASTQPPPSP